MKRLVIQIEDELHKIIHMKAAENVQPVRELVIESIIKHLKIKDQYAIKRK